MGGGPWTGLGEEGTTLARLLHLPSSEIRRPLGATAHAGRQVAAWAVDSGGWTVPSSWLACPPQTETS